MFRAFCSAAAAAPEGCIAHRFSFAMCSSVILANLHTGCCYSKHILTKICVSINGGGMYTYSGRSGA